MSSTSDSVSSRPDHLRHRFLRRLRLLGDLARPDGPGHRLRGAGRGPHLLPASPATLHRPMIPLLAVLLHDEAVDIIYFWSAILMVLLPIGAFSWLTYFVIKIYRREHPTQRAEARGWTVETDANTSSTSYPCPVT